MSLLAQIQEMEKRLLNAMLTSDVDELNLLIADQAIVIGTDSRLSNKTADIAAHRDGSLRLRAIVPQETTVQLFSSVAIVFALMNVQGSFQEQAFAGRFRYTRVWHNQNEKWQIVAAHISAVPN